MPKLSKKTLAPGRLLLKEGEPLHQSKLINFYYSATHGMGFRGYASCHYSGLSDVKLAKFKISDPLDTSAVVKEKPQALLCRYLMSRKDLQELICNITFEEFYEEWSKHYPGGNPKDITRLLGVSDQNAYHYFPFAEFYENSPFYVSDKKEDAHTRRTAPAVQLIINFLYISMKKNGKKAIEKYRNDVLIPEDFAREKHKDKY